MDPIPQDDPTVEKCNSSMQLTRAADYAVRVMIHLATLPAEDRAFLPDLAQATAAPESFLSKVMQALARKELISSRRGKRGGFAILPRGREATMREVIEAIDGPICLNVCLNGGKDCERKSWCPAHPVWARAQRAMVDVLMSVTVSAMAAKTPTSRPPRWDIVHRRSRLIAPASCCDFKYFAVSLEPLLDLRPISASKCLR